MEGINKIQDVNNGFCVPEAIYNQLVGQERKICLQKKDIFEQFDKITQHKLYEGVSIDNIKEWQFQYAKYTNIYIINGLQKIIKCYAPEKLQAKNSICLQLTNGHCTGIDNNDVKHDIIKRNKINLFNIDFDLTTNNYDLYNPDMLNKLIKGEINNNIILNSDNDIVLLMNAIIKETGYIIEQFNFRSQSNISAFVHPISNKLIMENNNYQIRKTICDKAFEIYKNDDFKFMNQSITKLSMSLFKIICGKIPKSTYNQLVLNTLDEYSPKPITKGYSEEFNKYNSLGFDICKCYSSILYNNNMNIPIYNIFCDLQDYDGRKIICGEYFIDNVIIEKYKGSDKPFIIYAGLYSWNLIKYLIDNKLMKRNKIKKMLLPCAELPFEHLKLFVETIYNSFEEDSAKQIINMFIGNMGTKYNKDIKGCIIDNEIEARSIQALYPHIEINEFNNLFLVKQVIKNKLQEDNTSINRFVVCGGIMKLLDTMSKVMKEDSKLISIRTDCVYVENYKIPNEKYMINDNDDKILNNIGKIKIEDKINQVKCLNEEDETFDINSVFNELQKQDIRGNGCIIQE